MKLFTQEGKIIVKKMTKENDEDTSLEMLKLEQWLNDSVATEANKKFGIMLRVHL
jgi:hypothetical protein